SACADLPHLRVLHDPLTPEEHVTLGLTYEIQGHRDLATREYRTALTQEAGYVPALIGLGNVAFAEGELEESETFYQQALEASPEHPGANNNLAMLYLARGGDLREAERLALRALAHKGPLQPYVLDTLAHVYARQGRYQEAVAALEKAEAVAPSQDKMLRDRLIRLRDQLVGTDAQEDRRTMEQPGVHQSPERWRDRSGEEVAI
ncbi:MAG TPA: tetratricopeptide repeat protein, partial [Nitrospiraceae bacterium]